MDIESIAEVRQLPSNITAQRLDEMLSDDDTTFSQIVAAEALCNVPYGVTAWLRSDSNIVAWVNDLTVKTVEHQVLHWRTRRGVDSRPAATVADRLARFRSRLADADALMRATTNTRRGATSKSQAMNRLVEANSPEFTEILDRLKEQHRDVWDLSPDEDAARLLAMSDEEFAAVVREDMEELDDVRDEEALAHPAVFNRWRDTLIALGDATMGMLGLDRETVAASSPLPYLIHDRHLPDSPIAAEERQWIRRLFFLAHLQARLTECQAIRREYGRRMGDLIFEPAEQELRRRHFVDYARLRIEEEQKEAAKPPPSTPGPTKFGEYAEALRRHGWEVTVTAVDRCTWLEARRDGDWMTVRARRRSGSRGVGWRQPCYFVHQRRRNIWHKLTAFEDVLALARLDASDHLAALNRLPSYQVVDPVYYFVAPRYATEGLAS